MTVPVVTGDGPLIVACLRIADLRPDIDPLSGAVTRTPWGIGLSAADGAALEHAFRIAEQWSGRVVAVTVGPSTVEPVLKMALALGAAVVRIPTDHRSGANDPGRSGANDPGELGADEQALARTIVATLAPFGPPSLVLCGDRSVDRGTGALPAYLAHELRAVQALGLVRLEVEPPTEGTGPALLAERRLDGGWRERLRVSLPAVCSVEGAGIRLRRASLDGALRAAATPVAVSPDTSHRVPSASAPVRYGTTQVFVPRTRVLPAPDSDHPRIRLLALTGALVAHDPPTIVGPVGSVEAADALIAFLVRHGYLDHPPAASPIATAVVR